HRKPPLRCRYGLLGRDPHPLVWPGRAENAANDGKGRQPHRSRPLEDARRAPKRAFRVPGRRLTGALPPLITHQAPRRVVSSLGTVLASPETLRTRRTGSETVAQPRNITCL